MKQSAELRNLLKEFRDRQESAESLQPYLSAHSPSMAHANKSAAATWKEAARLLAEVLGK